MIFALGKATVAAIGAAVVWLIVWAFLVAIWGGAAWWLWYFVTTL